MSHNISHIFYINLNRRVDRCVEIEKQLNGFNLSFERFSAIEHNMGSVGCSKSHISVLKLAKERGYKNVLILEDDFKFVVSKEEFENSLDAFFSSSQPNKQNFDVCMLSYNLIRFNDSCSDSVVGKIIEAQTTAGYLVQSHYYQILIDLWEHYTPLLEQTGQHWIYALDQCWKQLQHDNWFYFIKRIGKQRSGFSDIGQAYIDEPNY